MKEFHLSSNYLVNASVNLKNTSDKPLALPAQEFVIGTATPMDAGRQRNVSRRDVVRRHNYVDNGTSLFQHEHDDAFWILSRTPKTEFRAGTGNVVWAAAHNQFFALLAMPKQPAQQIVARPVNLPPLRGNQTPTCAGNGNPDGAGLSGADAAGEFKRRAADYFLRRAEGIPDAGAHRRGISKSRGHGDEFRHGLHQLLGRRDIFCQITSVWHELAARRFEARLRLGDCLDHNSSAA